MFCLKLSTLHYVYPSAAYSRFEHSVGVYHIAGRVVNLLKDQQPELKITAIDAMCVQVCVISIDAMCVQVCVIYSCHVCSGKCYIY